MSAIVERAQQVVEDVTHARSRRAFLAALEHFERILAVAPDYPRDCLSATDTDALGALADIVIAHVETRLNHHADRASVQRALAAKVDEIRADIENVYQFVHGGRPIAG